MKIHHIALWTSQLEEMKTFYETYFDGKSGEKYVNPTKGFESYFIKFEDNICLEIMSRKDITEGSEKEIFGLCHLAFAFGSRQEIHTLTERLRADGYKIAGEIRLSGDGYIESVILDPDGNRIELVTENAN